MTLLGADDVSLPSQREVLARQFGFIVNYDIKYRMGQDAEEDGGD